MLDIYATKIEQAHKVASDIETTRRDSREDRIAFNVKLHALHDRFMDVDARIRSTYPGLSDPGIKELLERMGANSADLFEIFLATARDNLVNRLSGIAAIDPDDVGFAGRSGGWVTVMHKDRLLDAHGDLVLAIQDAEQALHADRWPTDDQEALTLAGMLADFQDTWDRLVNAVKEAEDVHGALIVAERIRDDEFNSLPEAWVDFIDEVARHHMSESYREITSAV